MCRISLLTSIMAMIFNFNFLWLTYLCFFANGTVTETCRKILDIFIKWTRVSVLRDYKKFKDFYFIVKMQNFGKIFNWVSKFFYVFLLSWLGWSIFRYSFSSVCYSAVTATSRWCDILKALSSFSSLSPSPKAREKLLKTLLS